MPQSIERETINRSLILLVVYFMCLGDVCLGRVVLNVCNYIGNNTVLFTFYTLLTKENP